MAADDSNDWAWINKLDSFEKCDAYGILDDNKAKFALATQKYYSMLDSLCLCQFAFGPAWQLYGPDDLLKFCKFGVDWDATVEELLEVGERRINMMRLFNVREGFSRANDILPERMFIPIPDGPNAGAKIDKEDFVKALDKYYDLAGWDKETGVPKPETIKRLGLEWINMKK